MGRKKSSSFSRERAYLEGLGCVRFAKVFGWYRFYSSRKPIKADKRADSHKQTFDTQQPMLFQ